MSERSEIEDGPQVLRRGTSGTNQIANQVEMESDQREPGDPPAILRKGGHRGSNQHCAKRAMQQKVVVFGIERRLDAAARAGDLVRNQSEPIRIGKDSCQRHKAAVAQVARGFRRDQPAREQMCLRGHASTIKIRRRR